jgi:hypothetical protein
MTSEKPTDNIRLDDSQICAIIEMVIPRVAVGAPGMPPGMKCEIVEKGDKHWILRIERP